MDRPYIAVYIMTNVPRGTLYIGVTSDLFRRAAEHREGLITGFSQRYGLKRLVWWRTSRPSRKPSSGKSLKRYNRDWKINLVERENPDWKDLYPALMRGV